MDNEDKLVKVVLSANPGYNNFVEWANSLSEQDGVIWFNLLNKNDLSEQEFDLLAKKSIELYCMDMNIDQIPATQEYIESILSEFTMLYFVFNLQKDGYLVTEGNIGFGIDVPYSITEKGKLFFNKNDK